MSSSPQIEIILPHSFTQEHERVLTVYLSDDRRLDTAARQKLYEAIDLLSQAEVEVDTASYTFRQIYEQHKD